MGRIGIRAARTGVAISTVKGANCAVARETGFKTGCPLLNPPRDRPCSYQDLQHILRRGCPSSHDGKHRMIYPRNPLEDRCHDRPYNFADLKSNQRRAADCFSIRQDGRYEHWYLRPFRAGRLRQIVYTHSRETR